MTEPAEIDPKLLRAALGTFATGVTVVTTMDADGTAHGFTANSFTSVSLSPPLVLVCPARTSKSLVAMQASGVFAVNVLSEEQRTTSNLFASKTDDKFANLDWTAGTTGAPLLAGSAGWFDCTIEDTYPGGDHMIIVGRVRAFGEDALAPLGYFRGSYFSASLEQAGQRREGAIFAAIVEYQGKVLLRRLEDDSWALPQASRAGVVPLGGLLATLTEAGAPSTLNFLFSVADTSVKGVPLIVYRGQASAVPEIADSSVWRFWDEADCADLTLSDYETKMTLSRFFREWRKGAYSLFAETGDTGRLAGLSDIPKIYNRPEAEQESS